MSDLRNRIAAAIERAIPDTGPSSFVAVADSVIRELGMGIPCAMSGCRLRQIAKQAAARNEVVEDWHGKAGGA